MISPEAKDTIDVITGIGTLIGFASAGVAYLVSRHEQKLKGNKAIEQIDMLATNHLPHMETDMRVVKEEAFKTNQILTELRLGQVETNTILRDRRA